MIGDRAIAEIMRICREIGVTLHIRGTDDRPVVEVRGKRSRRVIGGKELKSLLAFHQIEIDMEKLNG